MTHEKIPFRMEAAEVVKAEEFESPEEFNQWKIQRKSNYSKPYQEKTAAELQEEFPNGRATSEGFTVDRANSAGAPIRSIFDEHGREIERAFYKPGVEPSETAADESFYKRISSHYDEDGYLVGVVTMKSSGPLPGGFVRKIEYEMIKHRGRDIRVPSRIITQEVIPNYSDPSLRLPGWHIPHKPPEIIDFTDVPYVPPKQ